MAPPLPDRSTAFWIAGALALLTLGIFLRVTSFEPDNRPGFDEQLYGLYVQELSDKGIAHYPQVISQYLQQAAGAPVAMLPPTRVTFIAAAALWHDLTGATPAASLRAISCAASILTLMLSCAFAWRLQDRTCALAVLLLMAVAPTQIYIAHRSLIDGFFACLTLLVLWSLWEVLRSARPSATALALYGVFLALLILTKENAAFVYAAILGLFVLNRWLKFGHVSRPLLLVTLFVPLLSVLLLVICAGGLETLFTVFATNVAQSEQNAYSRNTGNGPWFRYLSDILLTSPAILILAIAGGFSLDSTKKAGWYFFGFILITYALMCNVTNGMNLRYALIWDFPLRFLALLPLLAWAGRCGKWRSWFLTIALVVLAGSELDSYHRIFVMHVVDDPTPIKLMNSLDMIQLY